MTFREWLKEKRGLTSSQKKLLDKWAKANDDKVTLGFDPEDLPDDVYDKLEDMNDFETLHQEIERYIHDKI